MSLSRTLASPRALLPDLQRYKDTVRCAALGAEVPGHRQQQLTQTLIVCFSKAHFLHHVKSQNIIELVTRPATPQISNISAALAVMSQARIRTLQSILPKLANQSEDCLYLNVYAPFGGKNSQSYEHTTIY